MLPSQFLQQSLVTTKSTLQILQIYVDFERLLEWIMMHFFTQDKDGCGSGNDGDDEEDYGLNGLSKKNMYKNSWNGGGSFLPPYRHPPPYACPRSSVSAASTNPIMCQCCGQFQPQPQPAPQAWYQPPQFQHPLMMSSVPPLCPRAPNGAQLGKKHCDKIRF